jgi:hypothetical protein
MNREIHTGQHEDKMSAAELRKRTSQVMWGPLHVTIHSHCAGTELGYEAGQAAYRDHTDATLSLEDAMHVYLTMPKYRPRNCTPKIISEWQALFLLGWSSGLLDDEPPPSRRETDDQARRRYEASQPTLSERDFITRGREQR